MTDHFSLTVLATDLLRVRICLILHQNVIWQLFYIGVGTIFDRHKFDLSQGHMIKDKCFLYFFFTSFSQKVPTVGRGVSGF